MARTSVRKTLRKVRWTLLNWLSWKAFRFAIRLQAWGDRTAGRLAEYRAERNFRLPKRAQPVFEDRYDRPLER